MQSKQKIEITQPYALKLHPQVYFWNLHQIVIWQTDKDVFRL